MSETFGIFEAKSFCENHDDERVRVIWKWLVECRSKNAQWCSALAKAELRVNELEKHLSTTIEMKTL